MAWDDRIDWHRSPVSKEKMQELTRTKNLYLLTNRVGLLLVSATTGVLTCLARMSGPARRRTS
jgi:hypothetical protein